jgi:hypothetical protein
MVQSAKDRMRNNASEPLNRPRAGRVLAKRNVSSHFIIIGGVLRKNSAKVLGVENDQVISALAPNRPDQTFNIESGSFIQRQYLLALIRFSDDRGLALILVFVLLFFLFLVVGVSRRHCTGDEHRTIWPIRSSSGSSLQQSCPFLV